MPTVQQLISPKGRMVIAIHPDALVYEALALMAQHDIGALVVLESGQLAGMFSERDYARKVALHGRSSRDLRVSDVMTAPVFFVHPDDTVETCMALMTDKRVRHLPVCQHGEVVSLLSIGDVVKALLDEQRFVIQQLEQYITS